MKQLGKQLLTIFLKHVSYFLFRPYLSLAQNWTSFSQTCCLQKQDHMIYIFLILYTECSICESNIQHDAQVICSMIECSHCTTAFSSHSTNVNLLQQFTILTFDLSLVLCNDLFILFELHLRIRHFQQ